MYHLEVSVTECSNVSAPFELSIASASISALLLVITVPTNLLVCLAILVDPNRELRTQFNCFTFNLGLADLIVGCVTEPVSIYSHITEAFASERGHRILIVTEGPLRSYRVANFQCACVTSAITPAR